MVHGGAPYSLKVVASILPMRGGCLLKILVRLLYKKKNLYVLSFFFFSSVPLSVDVEMLLKDTMHAFLLVPDRSIESPCYLCL